MKNILKGTLTEENLLKAFAGESQARNRYNYFASQAKKEGYEQIAALFDTTADQEKEHAKRFFKFLEGGDVTITATYPAGKIGTTTENLLAAAIRFFSVVSMTPAGNDALCMVAIPPSKYLKKRLACSFSWSAVVSKSAAICS